jgi:hypothetical protein
VKLTTHLHLPLKLTMHGATSSCPHKSSWHGVTSPFTLLWELGKWSS